MKRLLVLGAVFCLWASTDGNAQVNSDWQWMHPKPQGNDIRFIKMSTPTNWVAVGYTGTMMRTTDAGARWLVHSNYFGYYGAFLGQGKNIYGGDFADANTGVVCGTQGWIARTTNSGVSWDSIGSSAGTIALWNASFGDPNIVYIGGNSGVVLKSTNAGLVWTSVTSPSGGANRTIFALNATTVYAGSLNGTIYRSTNGGTNWTPQVTGSTSSIIFGIYFFNADTGIVTGGSGYVRYTTNGGTSWNTPTVSVSAIETRVYARRNPAEAYLLGDVNNMYKSTDYGVTWTTIPYRYVNQPVGLSSNTMDINGNTWVVGGVNGLLNATTNSGTSWTGISNVLTANNVYSIDIAEGTAKVWASAVSSSGLNSSILFSSNRGATWNIQSTAPGADLRDIDMVNENLGFTCGFNGIAFKTTNGGTNWSQIPLPNAGSATLTRVDFSASPTGYIFGSSLNFWKTTDEGATWTQLPLGTTEGVKWADMVDATTGYFISTSITNTRIYKTTDGGANWTEQSYPNPGNLWRIKMINATTGYVCGDGGRLFRTTDGVTWVSVNAPTTNNYTTTDWFDIDNGVLGAGSGFSARTSNGGEAWTIRNTGGSSVWTMKMIHPDTIWSTQGFGFIFKYERGTTTGLIEWKNEVPESFVLEQNYPNPFNSSTTIRYQLPTQSHITMKVYNLLGQEVATLVNEVKSPGIYTVQWDASKQSSGIYFYKLQVGEFTQTRKLVLLR